MKAFWRLLRLAGRPFAYLLILLLRSPYEILDTVLLAGLLKGCFQAVAALDIHALYACAGRYALLFLALYICNGAIWTVNSVYAASFGAKLREKCYSFMSERELSQMESKSRADWITRLNGDTSRVMGMMTDVPQLLFLACAVVSLVFSSVFLGKADLAMLGVVLLFTVPHVLINQLFLARPMRALNAAVMRETAEASSRLSDLVDCALPIRANAAEGWMLSRFEEANESLRKACMRVRLRSALGKGLMVIMGLGGYLAAILLGSWAISAGKYDFGQLTALLQLRGGVIKGAMMGVNSILAIRAYAASADRICEMLDGK